MKNSKILVMMLTVLAFAACQKEDSATSLDGRLVFKIEGNDNTKTTVTHAGNTSTVAWVTGDSVRINDKVLRVVSDHGTASAANPFDGAVENFYAVYPSTLCNEAVGSSVTLNLPAVYTYAVSDGKQNLKTPMVAYAPADANVLTFKHVTAAIGVQVVNYYGFTIEVDSIKVISNSYQINGPVTVTMGSTPELPNLPNKTSVVDSQKTITMNVPNGALHIFAGDSTVVQVPVLPVGSDNRFTINVYVHKVDQPAVVKTLTHTQNEGGGDPQATYALGRAKLAYARFATPGLFSVSATKKVIISQGNLQYQASTGTWKFSETQYGYIGDDGGNATDTLTRKGQSAWIDLFGWGTSGYSNGNIYYMPYDAMGNASTSTGRGYGPHVDDSYEVDLSGTFDWGYNSINNGGGKTGRWRTLNSGTASSTEWSYLFNSRTTCKVYNKTNGRYAKAEVNGVKGVILFPDDFSNPTLSGSSSLTSSNINISSNFLNTVVLSDWYLLEAAGAAFLPCAGYRNAKNYTSTSTVTLSNVGTECLYWSSVHGSTDKAYRIRIYSGGVTVYNTSNDRNYGYSVRLVRDVN